MISRDTHNAVKVDGATRKNTSVSNEGKFDACAYHLLVSLKSIRRSDFDRTLLFKTIKKSNFVKI